MYKRRSPPSSPNTVMEVGDKLSCEKSSLTPPPPLASPLRRHRRKAAQPGNVELLPLVVLVAAFGIVGITAWALAVLPTRSKHASNVVDNENASSSSSASSSSWYTCPAVNHQPALAVNFDPVRFQNHYLQEEAHTLELKDFLANFRDTPYDDWGQTYTYMKQGMTDWKRRAIVPYIQTSGADHSVTNKIYESAIGMGLNAFMTLEIIQQELGTVVEDTHVNVEIHGNEYLVSSAQRANEFFDRLLPTVSSLHASKGNVCVGDSTNLSHVPSDTFDLVFTGYIL